MLLLFSGEKSSATAGAFPVEYFPDAQFPGEYFPHGGAAPTYTLEAGTGIYTLSGQDAGLFAHRLLTAGTGIYTLVGQDAVLLYTKVPPLPPVRHGGERGHGIKLLKSYIIDPKKYDRELNESLFLVLLDWWQND